MDSAFRWLVRVVVNLRFAVGLLTVIALISIMATVLGGMYGEEVQMRVFQSAPFSAIMVVFMFALGLAVASRWPWKKTHIGWISTHAGLIVICCGHMATCHLERSGRVDLFEGQATAAMEQDTWLLTADLPTIGTRMSAKVPLDLPPDAPIEGRSYGLPGGDTLVVERFWPTFNLKAQVTPDFSESGPIRPAVQFELRGGGRVLREWLVADEPEEAGKRLGDALQIVHQRMESAAAIDALVAGGAGGAGGRAQDGGRILAVAAEGKVLAEVAVEQALAGQAAVGESGYKIQIHKRFERLRIDDRVPVEADSGERNPAVLIEVADGAGKREHRWIFALHGEMTSGESSMKLPFELRYEPSQAGDGLLPPSSLYVLEADGREPVVAVTGPDGTRHTRPLTLGAPIALPWVGAEATFVERYSRATMRRAPWLSSYATNRPALLVSARRQGVAAEPERRWVVWTAGSEPTTMQGSSGPIELRYGPRKVPFGFTIELKDFVLETYEGSDSPKSFESFVRVVPHDGRPPFDYHIYMNHPLTFEGYTFFQSSYDPDTLKRSIFQVSYDPGWPIVYAGYALTVLGLFFVVWVKPGMVRAEAERRAAAGLARVAAAKAAAGAAGEGAKAEEVPS